MSVPRPAMLVETVTDPCWPARAMISASCSWNLALRTECGILARLSMRARVSEASTEAVPTSTGWPLSWASWIFSMTALNFSRRVLKTWSFSSTRSSAVGRDREDVEAVDVVELGGFGFGGSGHAGEFLVEAEVVLDRDGGEGLSLLLDGHAFLGFHGLVEAIGPAAAGHFAAGVVIDDDDLAVLDHVLDVFLVDAVGLQELGDVVDLLALALDACPELLLSWRSLLVGEVRSASMSAKAVPRSGRTKASGSPGERNSRPISMRSASWPFSSMVK